MHCEIETRPSNCRINRNNLGYLLAFSIASERVIDLAAALTYPLSPIPLSLATDDGYRRETSKSKLTYVVTEGVTLKDSKADDSVKKIKENTTCHWSDWHHLHNDQSIKHLKRICVEFYLNITKSLQTIGHCSWYLPRKINKRRRKKYSWLKSKIHNCIMQIETPSWFLCLHEEWKKQDLVDWDLIRGITWQFLVYAVQLCLSRKKMLHTASLNLSVVTVKEELS